MRRAESTVEDALGSGSSETVLASLIEIDQTLIAWSADTDGSGELERAREASPRAPRAGAVGD